MLTRVQNQPAVTKKLNQSQSSHLMIWFKKPYFTLKLNIYCFCFVTFCPSPRPPPNKMGPCIMRHTSIPAAVLMQRHLFQRSSNRWGSSAGLPFRQGEREGWRRSRSLVSMSGGSAERQPWNRWCSCIGAAARWPS